MFPEEDGRTGDRNRRTNDCTEVLWILDLVEGNAQKRRLEQKIFQIRKGKRRAPGDHTLVFGSVRQPIERIPRDALDLDDALVASEPFERLEPWQRSIVDDDALDCFSVHADELTNRLKACHQTPLTIGMIENHGPLAGATYGDPGDDGKLKSA